jgi:hypothetical protein
MDALELMHGRGLPDLISEISTQDVRHPGFPATRDGLRLAIVAIEDETGEALRAHRVGRRREDWSRVRAELVQVAAVAMRAVRSIDDGWTG